MSYDVKPTGDELEDLALASSRLWDLDENRLTPGVDYQLNLQTGKRIFEKEDMAEEKLFSGVDPAIWEKRTYLIFYHLLDNYERETGNAEEVTDREKQEMWDFLRACMQTKPMQYCFRYLVAKELCEDDEDAFLQKLYQAWFSFYRRDGELDSCGFEHVFVGELDDGHVKGLHNWLQTMVEEARGNLEYMGFVLPKKRYQSSDDEEVDGDRQLISVQLGWEGEVKDVSSMFVGTSPEFEMALYSMCFFAGDEVNRVRCGDYDVDIKCYRIGSKYGDKVSTAFPVPCEQPDGCVKCN
eukprot:TRINITY_DN7108_c0_g1_i2.p2 TRINITY_DN7108_c0_g1~~TRINITY_DN7108_c0_g1_i2.p2  ORF type:complete len:296 (-),score=39.20 TRINITY_DN7108_c0_g1_i2:65-952(-)